jgi:hypothetical protein
LQYINNILFITIIVSILGPKVRIYTRYRYIYTDLYRLMLTYLTYADHMLEIVKILVEIPEIAREFQPPKPLYSDTSVYR